MTVRDTLPKIPIIIAIWYSIAVTGDVPDNICPVIIPGKNTIPIPTMELMVGSIAESKVLSTISFDAVFGVAPSISDDSTMCFLEFIPSTNLSTPRDIPVIEFPISIPAIGIKYLGLYQGDIFITTNRKKIKLAKVPAAIDPAIIVFIFLDNSPLVLLYILFIANISIAIITNTVIQGFIFSNMYTRT